MNPPRQIGLLSATTIVAASMIGVGVFTTSGFALAALGTPSRVMAAWTVGAVIAMCGAISYAALAARFAESGGEYLFLARAIHPAAGLTAGAVSLLAGFTGPIAAAALGLEIYAGPLLGLTGDELPSGSIAILAILIAALLNTRKVGLATRIQNFIVIIKLAMIGMFITYACWRLWNGLEIVVSVFDSQTVVNVNPFSVNSFSEQLVWISFSFAGFNAAIYVAGEVRQPIQNVPRSIVGGTILVSVIYLLLNAIFVWSAPVAVITAEDRIEEVAATAAFALGGVRLLTLVRCVIVTALATSVIAMVMTGPRVYAKIAEDGFLPQFFRFEFSVDTSEVAASSPPTLAIWFQAGLAILVVVFASLQSLLGYLGLTLSLCSALTIASLYLLRIRGEIDRLPGFGIPPAVFILATISFGVIASWGNPWPGLAAIITLAMGAILYPLVSRAKRVA